MISIKRLEAMKRWQRDGGCDFAKEDMCHLGWGERAGLLRIDEDIENRNRVYVIATTEALAPAIAKAEAEHTRHRTLEQREVNRKRDGDANRAKQAAEPGLWQWRTWP